jgi:predicted methyltransferase
MLRTEFSLRTAAAGLACLLLLCTTTVHAADLGAAVVAAPDRSDEDRKADERRQPAKLLDFTGVKPGMTVLDLIAGGGYTTELLARAVGKTGKVYAQNSPGAPEKALLVMAERMKKPVMANVITASTPIDAPFPEAVHDVDLVTFILNYHDVTYLPVDRAKMNKALFDGLKHGGTLVIVDHAAKAGDGVTVGKTLHRIEESSVIAEVEAAGFKKVEEGSFLRAPNDPKDAPFFKMDNQPTDQFVLKFKKP